MVAEEAVISARKVLCQGGENGIEGDDDADEGARERPEQYEPRPVPQAAAEKFSSFSHSGHCNILRKKSKRPSPPF